MKLESDSLSAIAKALVAAQKEMGNAIKDAKILSSSRNMPI